MFVRKILFRFVFLVIPLSLACEKQFEPTLQDLNAWTLKELSYDTLLCQYTIKYPNSKVTFSFEPKPGETVDQMINRCRPLLNWSVDQNSKIKSIAADTLLNLKNSNWLRIGEKAINKDDFIYRLKLSLIAIDKNNSITVEYFDGGIFWGHSVLVEFDSTKSIKKTFIAG